MPIAVPRASACSASGFCATTFEVVTMRAPGSLVELRGQVVQLQSAGL